MGWFDFGRPDTQGRSLVPLVKTRDVGMTPHQMPYRFTSFQVPLNSVVAFWPPNMMSCWLDSS
jgi:hypothetical protein